MPVLESTYKLLCLSHPHQPIFDLSLLQDQVAEERGQVPDNQDSATFKGEERQPHSFQHIHFHQDFCNTHLPRFVGELRDIGAIGSCEKGRHQQSDEAGQQLDRARTGYRAASTKHGNGNGNENG